MRTSNSFNWKPRLWHTQLVFHVELWLAILLLKTWAEMFHLWNYYYL